MKESWGINREYDPILKSYSYQLAPPNSKSLAVIPAGTIVRITQVVYSFSFDGGAYYIPVISVRVGSAEYKVRASAVFLPRTYKEGLAVDERFVVPCTCP
jgi:hypothetical protein